MCKNNLEVRANEFEELADTKTGQTFRLRDNHGDNGDIFVGNSAE